MKGDESIMTPDDLQPVNLFLQNALNLKIKGNPSHYQHIVSQTMKRDDQDMLWRLYISLSSNISIITQRPDSFRDLIQSIYSYDWLCDSRVSIAYINLLGSIVSSNVTFLIPTLQFLIKSLISTESIPNMQTPHSSYKMIDEDHKSTLIHQLIRTLLVTVPTGQSELFPILASTFPHKRFDASILLKYVNHLYQICDYYPGIKNSILDLIISKCVELDVEIVIEDSGDVKLNEESLDIHVHVQQQQQQQHQYDELFIMEGHISASDTIKTQGFRQLSSHTHHKLSDEISLLADKLDILLVSLIQFITQDLLHHKTTDNMNIYLYQNLFTIFEEKILLTHRSKFVQFLFFYLAGYSHEYGTIKFYEIFATRLLKIFITPSNSPIKRQSAVLYLASYITRANFLSIPFVSHIFTELVKWSTSYTTNESGSCNDNYDEYQLLYGNQVESSSSAISPRGISTKSNKSNTNTTVSVYRDELGRLIEDQTALQKHETFYYCIQGLCYTLCFYGYDLLSHLNQNHSLLQEYETILLHPSLQPLKYCLHTVRYEFLRFIHISKMFSEATISQLFISVNFSLHGIIIPTEHIYTHSTQNSSQKENIDDMKKLEVDTNKPNTLTTTSNSINTITNPLETFFPYDPCLLISTNQYIEKYYRIWHSVCDHSVHDLLSHTDDGLHGDEENDDDEDNDEDNDEEDDEENNTSGISSTMFSLNDHRRYRSHSMTSSVMSSVSNQYMSMSQSHSHSAAVSHIYQHTQNLPPKGAMMGNPMSMSDSAGTSMGKSLGNMSVDESYWMPGTSSSSIQDKSYMEKYKHLMQSASTIPGVHSDGNIVTAIIGSNSSDMNPNQVNVNNTAETLPFRRPRFNSIGSTGSW